MQNSLPLEAAALRDRNLLAWIRLACLLLLAALALPFFLGKVYVADDLGAYHLPLRAFYSDQLARGEAFDWLPTLFNGFYLTGEGQLGTYHPLHLLLYRWLPLGAAFDLELLLSYPFMAWGTAGFLRRRLGSSAAAWFGALVFTFSGFNLLHFVHPNAVAVVAHLPWLLWAIDVALGPSDERSARRARLAIGLLTASQLLLGYPQYVWFSLIAEFGYVGWRITQRDSEHDARRVLMAQAYGFLAGAIQCLPTFDALTDSTRHAADAAFVNSGSLHPLNLVQLVEPYLFSTRVVGQNTHELGLYIGAVPCLLCAWLLANRRQLGALRPLAIAALALGVVGLLLAFGQFGFLYSLQQYLPVVGQFRFPCRAIVLFHLAVGVGAAIGFLLLIRRGDARALPRRTAIAWCVVGTSMALAALGPWLWSPYAAQLTLVRVGPALFILAALLIQLAASGRRWALYALVLFAAVDLGAYGASYAIFAPARTADLNQYVASTPVPTQDHSLQPGERIALAAPCEGTARPGNRVLLTGLALVDGYAGLEPRKQLDYGQMHNLQLAGARWLQNCRNADRPAAGSDEWTPILQPMPRARLVTRAGVSYNGPAEDVKSATIVQDRPGNIELTTAAKGRQLLIVSESYHDGWRATVDGQPCPVMRVDGDFLGCVVGPGSHRVELRFQPDSLRFGALLSACGLGLLLCSFVWGGRRRKDFPQPALEPQIVADTHAAAEHSSN